MPIPLLGVARRFSVLRSGWCQQWCRTVAGTLLPCETPRTLTAARRSSECRWRSTARSKHHRQRNLIVPTMVTVFCATVLNGYVRTTGPKNPLTKHTAEVYSVLYAWPSHFSTMIYANDFWFRSGDPVTFCPCHLCISVSWVNQNLAQFFHLSFQSGNFLIG